MHLRVAGFVTLILALNGRASCAVPGNTHSVKARAAPACKKAGSTTGLSCGLNGHYKEDTFAEFAQCDASKVTTVQQCALLCAQHQSSCESFEFNPSFQSCQFFLAKVADIFDPNSNASSPQARIYNDFGCYDCGNQFCAGNAQQFGQQLLGSAGFESPYLGPWCSYNVTYETTGDHSAHSVALSGLDVDFSQYHGDVPPFVFLSQSFNPCDGEYYEAAFDYKFRDKSSDAYVDGALFNGGFVQSPDDATSYFRGLATEATTRNWTRARLIRGGKDQVQDLTLIGFFSSEGSTANLLSIDNAQVFRRPAPSPIAGSSSPAGFNGKFENGKPGPWKVGVTGSRAKKPAPVVSPGIGDSKFALNVTADDIGTIVANFNVPTKPKTMYILSAQLVNKLKFKKSKNSNKVPQLFRIQFRVNTVRSNQLHEFNQDSSRDVKTFSQPFYIDSDLADIKISFSGPSGSFGGVLLDNISLLPMSEDL